MSSREDEELLPLRSVQATRSLLVIGSHLQRKRCVYEEFGGDYFDDLHAERLKRHLVKRLEGPQLSVTLQPQAG